MSSFQLSLFCFASSSPYLAVNHRKALSPQSAFPAQLLDVLAGYVYLLTLKFEPKNIVFAGDSSGAHVLLGLARYLAELHIVSPGLQTGVPGALILVSPSVDLSHPPRSSISTDFLVPYVNRRAYPSLSRHFPPDALSTNPYFSPGVAGDHKWLAESQKANSGLPHVWVQYGDSELLTPDQQAWVNKLRAEGVEFELDVIEGGAHLDAGLAFALLERGLRSSWTRLIDGVSNVIKSLQ